MVCPPWLPLVAQRMEVSTAQVANLRDLVREGRELKFDSDPGDQVRWRVAALVYLCGTVPADHLMWKALPYDWEFYSVPASYPAIARQLFGKYWGPVLGALEGLLALWKTSGKARRGSGPRAIAESTSGNRPAPSPRPARRALPAASG